MNRKYSLVIITPRIFSSKMSWLNLYDRYDNMETMQASEPMRVCSAAYSLKQLSKIVKFDDKSFVENVCWRINGYIITWAHVCLVTVTFVHILNLKFSLY